MKALLFAYLMLSLPTTFARSLESKRDKAQYPDLYEYVDTYDWEPLFASPPARDELAHLLPPAQRATLKTNLQTRRPFEFIGGYLVVKGLVSGQGFDEAAIVAIAPADGRTFVSLSHAGTVTTFGRGDETEIPLFMQEWATRAAGDENKVRFVSRP